MPKGTLFPVWAFDLETARWRIVQNDAEPPPGFFAKSATYDARRDTFVAYLHGIWEMGPARDRWQRATAENHHSLHHSIEYDSTRGLFGVFGDYKNTDLVWLYTPGLEPGTPGQWEKREPAGERPPPSQSFPVAFDSRAGVFLLVVDVEKARGASRGEARTYVYDIERNRYLVLPLAGLNAVGMNYNMVYDSRRGVFLLVTGDWRLPPIVWVLRLNLSLLDERR